MKKQGLVGALLLASLSAANVAAASSDLADAAQRGQWTQVRTLLKAKTAREDVKTAQSDGMTALHWAVQSDQVEMVTALLAAGADPNAANRYGITPLWLAATNGSTEVVRQLLKAGADAKATMAHGETALMAAARTGRPEPVKLLLDAGADPNVQETSQGESALMWAAAEDHGDAIKVLIAGGANPNLHAKVLELAPWKWMQVGMVDTMLPRGGFTAAMYAARQDKLEAIRALADSGANLDEQDPDGATAVQLAIINQHYDAAVLLIEKGANPNVADNSGMTAIYAAVDMNNFRSDIGRPARLRTDQHSAVDVIRVALAHGGNPNATLKKAIIGRHHGFGDNSLTFGATALMRAAKSNDNDAMRALLEGGANPSQGMASGLNPLLLLVGNRIGPGPGAADKVVEGIRLLVQHGADINGANRRGETALIVAARSGTNPLVKVLAEMGANLDAKDLTGKTALDVASTGRNARPDTAKLLRELIAAKAR